MSDVRVERLRWWHLDQVLPLEQALFPTDSWSAEQFWQELAQPTRRYLVALDDDRVIGYGGAFVLPPDSDIQTLAVDPGRQGEGLGGRLLGRLNAEAASAGCTSSMLEVRADNEAAIALYTREGYARLARRPRYYPDGGDALILRRRLAAGEGS